MSKAVMSKNITAAKVEDVIRLVLKFVPYRKSKWKVNRYSPRIKNGDPAVLSFRIIIISNLTLWFNSDFDAL